MIKIVNIRDAIRENNLSTLIDVILFAIITYVLHVLWWNVFWKFEAFSFLHQWASVLANWVFVSSSWALHNIFGLIHNTYNDTLYFESGYIAVIESCSGLKQFYQLFFLLLFFPGPIKHKIWFIPSGIFLIFLVNVFRIVALSFILIWWPNWWDFGHMWVLRPFYYVVIFIVWMIWVEKFRHRMSQKNSSKSGK